MYQNRSGQHERQSLVPRAARRFRVTTDSKHTLPVAPNLLKRDFVATAPNQKWAGDITYLQTSEGWLYLTVVIDLYSRRVIGWSIGTTMKADLVSDALNMALWRRRFPAGTTHEIPRYHWPQSPSTSAVGCGDPARTSSR